ncbi:MAG: peptidylprolyl isomerase [Bacteroidetes bacterium]|nr:peptidylprolyl isomerase [Bacteroidota bacterium]
MQLTRSLFFIILISLSPLLKGYSQQTQDTVIDGVVAVVGGNMVLKSDIEGQYLQLRGQGIIKGSPAKVKCQILDKLLYMKLLLHQAQVDSIKVTDSQVEAEMDRRMRYFISQAGSPEKLEEYYQKSLLEIKNELKDIIREQMLTEQEEAKVTKDITTTPSEVKSFYRKIDKDSIPLINAEFEIGLIIKQPVIGQEEKQIVINKLKGFKERIAKGDEFATLAVLYSEDAASAKQGGELGMFKRGDMRPEFEAASFKLKTPGEVSDIVETEDGFHIIQLIERRGEYINVRHILLQPQVSMVNLNKAKASLDSVVLLISSKKLKFDDAVIKYSDDPSKNNGGLVVNNVTGTTRFEANQLSQLDPKVFFIVDKLKVGEVSQPVLMKTDRGKQEYRIYYLKDRTSPHRANLENDYARIQQMTLNQKKDKVINVWINQKLPGTYIKISEQYYNCEFTRKWIR